MQVTFSAEDPLDRVVAAVEAVYGVRLKVRQARGSEQGQDQRVVVDEEGGPEEGKVRQDKT